MGNICNINIDYNLSGKKEKVNLKVQSSIDQKGKIKENQKVLDFINYMLSFNAQKAALKAVKNNDFTIAKQFFSKASQFAGNITGQSFSGYVQDVNSFEHLLTANSNLTEEEMKSAAYGSIAMSRGQTSRKSMEK